MKSQKSILYFLQKPWPGKSSSGGLHCQEPPRPDPNPASDPDPDPDPDIRGTDTPPEKRQCSFFRANSPANGGKKRSDSKFSSIMHKFKRDAGPGSVDMRKNNDHASLSSHLDFGEFDENESNVRKNTPGKDYSKTSMSMSNDAYSSDPPSFELCPDIMGPETPAMRPLVPRLKRVQEDCRNAETVRESSSFGSRKKVKCTQDLATEKTSNVERYENSSKFEWLNPSTIRDAKGRRPDDLLYDKRTLYIPPDALKKMSACQKQYWSVKCKYMDIVLFFKVGKFYELYEVDAEIGQKELDWKMTISGVGNCRQVGISESGIAGAVQKLIARGYKVGRMEQLETSDQAKARGKSSVIERKLVHVSTPSTTIDNNIGPYAVHLLALKEGVKNGSPIYGFAFLDYAALKFWVGSISDDGSFAGLGALLMQVSPREIVYESSGLSKEAHKALIKYASAGRTTMQLTPVMPSANFLGPEEVRNLIHSKRFFTGSSSSWTSAFDCATYYDLTICALGGLLEHLSRLKLDDALRNGELLPYHVYKSCLRMDGQTLVNLEIFSNNVDGGLAGTLLKHLDHCITSSGKRLLRRWICHPLKDIDKINDRLNIVEGLVNQCGVVSIMSETLRRLPDLERLLGQVKATVGSSSMVLLPFVGEKILKQRIKAFGTLVKGLRMGTDLLIILLKEDSRSLPILKVLNLPVLSELDELLKQFEVAVNDDFPQYQDHTIEDSDAETLSVLVELFVAKSNEWSHVIEALNSVDVLQSFAVAAISSCGSTTRPVLLPVESRSTISCPESKGPILRIKGLWHPYAVVDNGNSLVPNDIYLGEGAAGSHPRALLLTGPNMGGKSTLLRATCLAVILAQVGCYVPCDECVLSPVDVIFTRLGATDRIMSGESISSSGRNRSLSLALCHSLSPPHQRIRISSSSKPSTYGMCS
ncbi:DNA mismatch repair protein MSH7 isoform X2 [Asparagus officinalis]|uniref:DNA mismatch repair protein MSH7 isoform X2 n=1 Tax=Asparagus officinalis TaxID=4686 RepID=UPI00098E3396|nr:DNA mismatch repair protein MSH7 isoform X2 [Asparagus officinalis]